MKDKKYRPLKLVYHLQGRFWTVKEQCYKFFWRTISKNFYTYREAHNYIADLRALYVLERLFKGEMSA